ncbi:hypothetical protein COOONC_16728 [Cooperia oncophora]
MCRFPASLAELSIFSSLRGRISVQKNTDMSRVMRLLQISDEQLDAVRNRDQMAQFREEILSNVRSKDEDLGVVVDRIEQLPCTNTSVAEATRKPSSADSGLDLSSETSLLDAVVDRQEQGEDVVDDESLKLVKKRKRKVKKEVSHADISLLSTISVTSPVHSGSAPDSTKRRKKKNKFHKATCPEASECAEGLNTSRSFSLVEGDKSLLSSPDVLSKKRPKQKKKRMSEKVSSTVGVYHFPCLSIVSRIRAPFAEVDDGDEPSNGEQILSKKRLLSASFSEVPLRNKKRKKKRISQEVFIGVIEFSKFLAHMLSMSSNQVPFLQSSSLVLSPQSSCCTSYQRSFTDDSSFKTPKKLKRKLTVGEGDGSSVKRGSFDGTVVCSEMKARKKKKKASLTSSFVEMDDGNGFPNGKRTWAEKPLSSANSSTLSVRSGKKKKRRRISQNTPSMDLSPQSPRDFSYQSSFTDDSCFKTPKKLKRKLTAGRSR